MMQDLPKVIFTLAELKFENIKDNIYPMDRKYKICFETEEIQNSYTQLLTHECPVCEDKVSFKTFQQLDKHLRREHEHYYCDLCVTNFRDTAACLGYLGPHPGSGLRLMEVNFPCSRWISESCAVRFDQSADDLIIGLCPACSSDKVDIIKREDSIVEGKNDPIDVANHFLIKQEPSEQNASYDEITNEADLGLHQFSDDPNEHPVKNILVSTVCSALGCEKLCLHVFTQPLVHFINHPK